MSNRVHETLAYWLLELRGAGWGADFEPQMVFLLPQERAQTLLLLPAAFIGRRLVDSVAFGLPQHHLETVVYEIQGKGKYAHKFKDAQTWLERDGGHLGMVNNAGRLFSFYSAADVLRGSKNCGELWQFVA